MGGNKKVRDVWNSSSPYSIGMTCKHFIQLITQVIAHLLLLVYGPLALAQQPLDGEGPGYNPNGVLHCVRQESSLTAPLQSVYSVSGSAYENPTAPYCNRTFIGKTYAESDIKVKMTLNPAWTNADMEAFSYAEVYRRDTGIYKRSVSCGGTTPIDQTAYRRDSLSATLFQYYSPEDSIALDMHHPVCAPPFDTSTVGYERGIYDFIYYYKQTLSPGAPLIAYPFLHGDLVVIPKIKKIWIEAEPICAQSFLEQETDYHFKVKTDPPLSDMMFKVDRYVTGGPAVANACPKDERHRMINDATASGINYIPVLGASQAIHSVNQLRGSYWNDTTPPFSQQQIEDRWISYADLEPYVNPAGQFYGQPIYLTLHVSDEYLFDSTLTVPLMIETSDPNNPGGYHTGTYTVSGNETWTPQNNPFLPQSAAAYPTYRIKDKLTIPPDASLTIQGMTIEFGPEGSYEVQASPTANGTAGGKLTLDGAKLTGYRGCGLNANQAMWQGGEVWGCSTCPQGLVAGQVRQGWLELINGSEISFANEAARVWKRDDWSFASAGGIVQATASAFRNNGRSLEFIKYRNFLQQNPSYTLPNRSFFRNCDFVVNRQLSPYAFRVHMSGWDVKGVEIKGCRFKNQALLNGYYTVNGTGIEGYDFGFSIDNYSVPNCTGSNCSVPTEFVSLHRAIHNQSVTSPFAVRVNRAKFYNNYEGVSLKGATAPVVTGNAFEIPGMAPWYNLFPDYSFSGVFIKTGSGYQVTGNTFTGQGSGFHTGALIWGTGGDNNYVERNTFSELFVGGLSNYQNRHPSADTTTGLQFLCNTHTAMAVDEAARGSNSGVDGMRENQGSPALAAGNIFNSGGYIYNPPSEVGGVNYYHSGGVTNPPNTVGVNKLTGSTNSCKPPSDNPSDWTPPKGFDGPRIAGGFRSIPAPLYYYLANEDGTASRDSLYYWAGQWQSPYGDLLITDLLIQDGRLDEVDEVYNGIVDAYGLTDAEADEFQNWGRRLIDLQMALAADGRHERSLDDDEVAVLEEIAEGAAMWARVRAQAWLSLHDGRSFADPILLPELEEEGGNYRMAGGSESKESAVQASMPPAVYPNPVGDILTVRYGAVVAGAALRVHDVAGRQVMQVSLSAGEQAIDVAKLQTGIYLWHISDNGLEKAHGKFVKE